MPYSYVPPLTGWAAASCALLSPLAAATSPAAATARMMLGPVIPAAMPMLTNTPVPTMEPRPRRIADGMPSSRRSCVTPAIVVDRGQLPKRRSRSELETTETLENAMAPAAIIGFSNPAAASGMAAEL